MEEFADFLPFSEEVQEAFESYNIEATSLTIKAFPTIFTNGAKGSIIGRVVWRSPLLKIGKQKNHDALHFTLMDADKAEITGTAWGKIALRFDEVLQQGQIYKFSNAVIFGKKKFKAVSHDIFESRVLNQSIELRYSGLEDPELVRQINFPDIDHSQFRTDYGRLKAKQVAALVGIVVSVIKRDNYTYICLSNGLGSAVHVCLSEEKFLELKDMTVEPMHTVLGILGAGKLNDVNTTTLGQYLPQAAYRTFNDSLFVIEPECAETKNLVIWRNQLIQKEKSG